MPNSSSSAMTGNAEECLLPRLNILDLGLQIHISRVNLQCIFKKKILTLDCEVLPKFHEKVKAADHKDHPDLVPLMIDCWGHSNPTYHLNPPG